MVRKYIMMSPLQGNIVQPFKNSLFAKTFDGMENVPPTLLNEKSRMINTVYFYVKIIYVFV